MNANADNPFLATRGAQVPRVLEALSQTQGGLPL